MTTMIDDMEYFKFQQTRVGKEDKYRYDFLEQCVKGVSGRIDIEIVHLRNKAVALEGCMCDTHGGELDQLSDELEAVIAEVQEYEKYYQK